MCDAPIRQPEGAKPGRGRGGAGAARAVLQPCCECPPLWFLAITFRKNLVFVIFLETGFPDPFTEDDTMRSCM